MGAEWLELVRLWEVFEAREGFASPSNLSPHGRPPCVAEWIKRARAPSYRPPIANLDDYAQVFTQWWGSLQPEWRRSSGSLVQSSGDLDVLRKPGVNGLLSVLAALFFWGLLLGPGEFGAWLKAVDDVSWALRRLQEP